MKDVRVTNTVSLGVSKTVKEVRFERVWSILEAKNVARDNHSQNI